MMVADVDPFATSAPACAAGPVEFVILGQPASKANSRKPLMLGHGDKARIQFVKSDAAYEYEQNALRQIPPRARLRIEGPVRITLYIFYQSERPDLDESIVLDVLQDRWKKHKLTGDRHLIQAGVYRNDRQVREKHVFHGIDKVNPRCEIRVEPLQAQQQDLA
jgi:Holliday junction resolvase RusA-like endonuclease